MTLGYPRGDTVLGLKGQSQCQVRTQQYGVGSNSMSAFRSLQSSFAVIKYTKLTVGGWTSLNQLPHSMMLRINQHYGVWPCITRLLLHTSKIQSGETRACVKGSTRTKQHTWHTIQHLYHLTWRATTSRVKPGYSNANCLHTYNNIQTYNKKNVYITQSRFAQLIVQSINCDFVTLYLYACLSGLQLTFNVKKSLAMRVGRRFHCLCATVMMLDKNVLQADELKTLGIDLTPKLPFYRSFSTVYLGRKCSPSELVC